MVTAIFNETPRAAPKGQNSENGICCLGSIGDGDVKLWRLKCEDYSGFFCFVYIALVRQTAGFFFWW